jgi:hypothetical protein
MPAGKDKILRVLPFLGEVHTVQGQRVGDRLVFTLPAFERGVVAWIEDAEPAH